MCRKRGARAACAMRNTTLIATCASCGMPWTLFRPTLIYGAGVDKSLTPIVQAALRCRVFPIPAGRGQRQPVHAEDIATAIMAAPGSPFARGHTFPIGGGERMSAAEMFRRVRRSAGGPTLPAPIPPPGPRSRSMGLTGHARPDPPAG